MDLPILIDINADLGEGIANEANWMPWISSCNIACGGHAGNNDTIKKSVDLALEAHVHIGMHPSFPDIVNFGRKKMDISETQLSGILEEQINCFLRIADASDTKVHHLKCHGSLYHEAANEPLMANMLVDLWKKMELNCIIYLPPCSYLESLCIKENIPFWWEAFGDRRYLSNGQLAPRKLKNAMINDPQQALEQVLLLSKIAPIAAVDGTMIQIPCDTICFHSDGSGSLELLQYVINGLKEIDS